MPSIVYAAAAYALCAGTADAFAPMRTPLSRPSGVTSVNVVADSVESLIAAAPGISALTLLAGSQASKNKKDKEPSIEAITVDIALARKNFGRWNDALQTKNSKTVANMYDSSDLSFLPTVSPKHIKDSSNTEDYFTAFVQKNPFGTITDDSVQAYSDGNAYLHSGLYTFELGEANARTPVQARFSYVWKMIDGSWKISHHHSSVVPSSPPSATDMLGTARANFNAWNGALQTKNAVTVANMYISDNLSFLPTVSGDHIKSGGSGTDTEDYFKAFVQKNPFGTITDDSVQVYGAGDTYLHSGLYTFELGEADARTPVLARFSYIWQKVGSEWKIAHHHSSVRPGEAAAPVKKGLIARIFS